MIILINKGSSRLTYLAKPAFHVQKNEKLKSTSSGGKGAMASQISVEYALQKKNAVFLDTRTSAEFAEDHLPGAINLPILSDDERAVVGTLYKQVSQEKALEKGKDFFMKKLPEFLKNVEKYKKQEIIVNCWRGGMRSKVVAELLAAQGYKVWQLQGGYKEYRRYVRERLEHYVLKPRCIVVWGRTCTGKTALLSQFPHSLDLEGLAQHRGSLFGAIGLKPHAQKMFESLLLQRLEELQNQKYILVEGESKKIGEVQIPHFLYRAMMEGIAVLLKADLATRAQNAVKEYLPRPEDREKVLEIVSSLQKVISKAQKHHVQEFFQQGKYAAGVRILLEYYYDPLYDYTLKKRTYVLEMESNEGAKVMELLKKNHRLDELKLVLNLPEGH